MTALQYPMDRQQTWGLNKTTYFSPKMIKDHLLQQEGDYQLTYNIKDAVHG